MKIVSWNAGMKFREKFKILDEYYHADLYVIQECEDPARTKNKEYQKFAQNYLWIGDNKNKGLGVFASNNSLPAYIIANTTIPFIHNFFNNFIIIIFFFMIFYKS